MTASRLSAVDALVASKRGGKRPGAGRPKSVQSPKVPATSVRLQPELAARVRALREQLGHTLPDIVRAGVETLEGE